MIESISWLGKEEELEFRKIKFRGKAAGKIHVYSNYVDGLIRTRAIILIMSVLVLYPVLIQYLSSPDFNKFFLVERLIFMIFYLIGGLCFNKFRIASIILALIPSLLIFANYILIPSHFNLSSIGYTGAILISVVVGFYYNFKVKKIEKDLRQNNLNLLQTFSNDLS